MCAYLSMSIFVGDCYFFFSHLISKTMKTSFLFSLTLCLVLLLSACGNDNKVKCTDPEALNNLGTEDCMYPADKYPGTYAMTCNCVGNNPQSPNFTKTFTLTMSKNDKTHISLSNILGCTATYNALVVQANPFTFSFGSSAMACDSLNFMPIGTANYAESSKTLTLSFSMNAVSNIKSYNCSATGTKQ